MQKIFMRHAIFLMFNCYSKGISIPTSISPKVIQVRNIAFLFTIVLTMQVLFTSKTHAEERNAEEKKVNHQVLGQDKGHVVHLDENGGILFQFKVKAQSHDIWKLANGNYLFLTAPATISEVSPKHEVVWSYSSKPAGDYTGKIEVHAFQPLENDLFMIAETGNKRIIEVDRTGKIQKIVPLTVDNPHPHTDTRMARKLASGNYLVCHEADGILREYDATGKVVWSYKMELGGRPETPGHGVEGHGTKLFGAVRLPNGNTLIAGGNNNRVLEVNPQGEIVWSINHDELPNIKLAWVTTLHVLPNGNIIFGNCHAGPENPQLIEVTKDKKVVWTFSDFKNFGNSLATAQILGVKGDVIR